MSESLFTSLLTENPYFSAGFGLLGVGTGLAVLRQGVIRSAGLLRRRLLTTLEITSRDAAYPWVLQWITRQRLSSGGHFSLSTRRKVKNVEAQRFQLVPAPGVHYLRWSGRWIQVSRERERSLVDFGGNSTSTAATNFTAGPFETVTLTTIGRAEKAMRSLLEEAERTNAQLEEGKLVVWTAWGQDWRPFGQPRRRRPLNSVVLSEGVSTSLLADLKDFLANEKWYQSRGIPYRRGYLLEGPPGGGKSSFVQALAGELGYNICVLSLSEGWLTDDRFNHLLNSLPERSFLLLEDIDATGPSRDDKSTGTVTGSGRLTFSGLLNALDGVTSAEERIIFMTTNHRERLDPALIRPGRVDYHQHIGWADSLQARQLFLNFFPEHGHLAERFGRAVGEWQGNVSPAAIQGHFILYKNSPQEAVENIDVLMDNDYLPLPFMTTIGWLKREDLNDFFVSSSLTVQYGFLTGFLLGGYSAGQRASLQFLAENQHELPRSRAQALQYHRNKNYRMMAAFGVGGIRRGGQLAVVAAAYSLIKKGLQIGREGNVLSGLNENFDDLIAGSFVGSSFFLISNPKQKLFHFKKGLLLGSTLGATVSVLKLISHNFVNKEQIG